MTDVGSQGVCTAEYVCGVPGILESGEEDVVQQPSMSTKEVSIDSGYISDVDF